MTVYASSRRALLAGLSFVFMVGLAFFTSALPAAADDTCPGSPKCPSQQSATADSWNSVNVKWVDPSAHQSLTHFIVSRSTDGVNFTELGGHAPTYQGDGYYDVSAAQGTTYIYKICAVYGSGDQACVTTNSVTTSTFADLLQPPPPNVQIDKVTSTYAKVEWTASKAYDFYNIKMGPTGQSVGQIEIDSKGNNGWYQWTTLTPNTNYTFAVEGCVSAFAASSDCSHWGFATLKTPATDAPAQAPGPPVNLRATAKSSSEIDLSWAAPPGATGFKLITGLGPPRNLGPQSRGTAVHGLKPYAEYEFDVCVLYNNAANPGDQRPCALATARTKGPVIAPTTVIARVQSPGVNVAWDHPPNSDDEWFEVENLQAPTSSPMLHVPRVATWVVVSGRLNANRNSYYGTFSGGEVRVCTGNNAARLCSAAVKTQSSNIMHIPVQIH